MNKTTYLLVKVMEEAAEIAGRASKAACFGIDEVQPGQALTNGQRLAGELDDLMGVLTLLDREGIFAYRSDEQAINRKIEKLHKFMQYSRECGTLEPAEPAVAPIVCDFDAAPTLAARGAALLENIARGIEMPPHVWNTVSDADKQRAVAMVLEMLGYTVTPPPEKKA